jgi:hypothetical protein
MPASVTAMPASRRPSSPRRIVLVGAAGVGKTSLGVAVVRELSYQRTQIGMYCDARSLAFARRIARSALKRLSSAQVIDADLGLDPDVHHSAVGDVLYQRHAKCGSTSRSPPPRATPGRRRTLARASGRSSLPCPALGNRPGDSEGPIARENKGGRGGRNRD